MSRKIKVKAREIIETKINEAGEKTSVKTKKIGIPKVKKNKVLAIILKENKSTVWHWVSFREERFRVDGNAYFLLPEGIYLSANRILFAMYMEGVSTPMTHKNIEKETVTRTYVDPHGNEQEIEVEAIKGLKFDSKIIDVILNRGIAEEFTKEHFDMPQVLMILLLVGVIVIGIANIIANSLIYSNLAG